MTVVKHVTQMLLCFTRCAFNYPNFARIQRWRKDSTI